MEKEIFLAQRKKAVDTVDNLLADIESSVKRGVAVFGPGDFLGSILPSFIGREEVMFKIGETYTGERRDLKELLECKDWVSTALMISSIARQGNGGLFRPGDYFRLPIKADAGTFGGLKFEALNIPEAELVVVQAALDGKIIFNFEEILFYSAITPNLGSVDWFKESALCKYLNIRFLDTLDPIRGVLQKNRDGNLVTLPTLFEVFGNDDTGGCNWEEEPRQLEYFKKIKNRIRVKDNDTHWCWLSTADGITLNGITSFAAVESNGDAGNFEATSVYGGVAPAVCIA
jgi:hypothetical protein